MLVLTFIDMALSVVDEFSQAVMWSSESRMDNQTLPLGATIVRKWRQQEKRQKDNRNKVVKIATVTVLYR